MSNPESHSEQQEKNVSFTPLELGTEDEAAKSGSVDKYSDPLFQPIPVETMPSVAGWKEVKLEENHDPMVPLGPFSYNHDIFTSSVYYGEHNNSPYMKPENQLEGSLITMFVRQEVAGMLRHAQQLLPEGHHLIVLDSYRSLDVQQALYDHYFNALKGKHPDWSEESLSNETQKYVSLPSRVESRPSPHNTGGAVDLAIYRLPGEVESRINAIDLRLDELSNQAPANPSPLDEARNPVLREQYLLEMEKIGLIRRHAEFLSFGTQFDHGGGEAASNYFERLELERPLTAEETEARDNRRMLYNAMVQAGMVAYEDEWWHFNSPKSQMGAKAAGLDRAEYGGLELTEDLVAHEQMRKAHRAGLIRIQEGLLMGYHLAGKVDPLAELIDLNEQALSETGDPRLTFLPKAAIIAPPETEAA